MYLFNIINIFLNNVIDTGDIMLKKLNMKALRAYLDPSD